jgi:hypothetical protein
MVTIQSCSSNCRTSSGPDPNHIAVWCSILAKFVRKWLTLTCDRSTFRKVLDDPSALWCAVSGSIANYVRYVYCFDGVCLVFSSSRWSYIQCMFDTFCIWVQHVVCSAMVEEEKKDQIHDQNGGETNRYVSFKDICVRQNASRVLSPHRRHRRSAPPPVALNLGGRAWPLTGGWFCVLYLGYFSMSSRSGKVAATSEVRIRFSWPYPFFGGASSVDGERVEVCVLRISLDLVSFCVRWFDFRSDSLDLWLS